MPAGLGPVWDGEVRKGVNGVKKELINYWEGEARKGRTIEENARYNDSTLDLHIITNIVPKRKIFLKVSIIYLYLDSLCKYILKTLLKLNILVQ